MKFNITCDNEPATVEIVDGQGNAFTGTIVAKVGTGTITGTQNGNSYSGDVSMDGYNPTFTATVTQKDIAGEIRDGWLFDEKFTGTLVA